MYAGLQYYRSGAAMQSEIALTQEHSPLSDLSRAGKYLVFHLGREHFGIRVLKVREIMGLLDITAVPHTPVFVKGVFNLRGKVIPVIDLRIRFQMPELEYSPRTCIIVVSLDGKDEPVPMGLIVDGVAEVLNIAESDIEAPPVFGNELDTSYLLGIAKVRGEVKLLLDIDRALNVGQYEALTKLGSSEPLGVM
jgi:purine-binding chemotaxis protein CheW